MAQTDDEKVFQQPHDGQYSSGYVFRGVMARKQREGQTGRNSVGRREAGREREERKREESEGRGGVGGGGGTEGERERETETYRDRETQREKTERDRRNNIKHIKRARYELTGLHTTPQKGEGQAEKEKTAV